MREGDLDADFKWSFKSIKTTWSCHIDHGKPLKAGTAGLTGWDLHLSVQRLGREQSEGTKRKVGA